MKEPVAAATSTMHMADVGDVEMKNANQNKQLPERTTERGITPTPDQEVPDETLKLLHDPKPVQEPVNEGETEQIIQSDEGGAIDRGGFDQAVDSGDDAVVKDSGDKNPVTNEDENKAIDNADDTAKAKMREDEKTACNGPEELHSTKKESLSKEQQTIPNVEKQTAQDKAEVVVAPLDHYIRNAERTVLPDELLRTRIFNEEQRHLLPKLKSGSINRIIIFSGKFNPPHRGHLEILCHAFLRTDDKTIAVMIMPVDTHYDKKYTWFNGKIPMLSKDQRMSLWEDDVLGRFAWVWPGPRHDHNKFIVKIQELAKKDGFDLIFTSLFGSDHSALLEEGRVQFGCGSTIFSDITRPARFLSHKWASPPPVPGWSEWKRPVPGERADRSAGSSKEVHCPQWPCWVCWKLERLFPECLNEGYTESPQRLAGDTLGIVKRCHEGQGVIWRARHPDGRWMWFLSSGRQYPIDPYRPLISSSQIRVLIETAPIDEVYDRVKDMVLNPASLQRFLGMQDNKRKLEETTTLTETCNKHKHEGTEEVEMEVTGKVDDIDEKPEDGAQKVGDVAEKMEVD